MSKPIEPCRVEVPVYSDAWMRGDRYGTATRYDQESCLLTVRLDKSGRTHRYQEADCRYVD